MSGGDLLHVVTNDNITDQRRALGRAIIWGSAAIMLATALAQTAQHLGWADFGFTNWRPTQIGRAHV